MTFARRAVWPMLTAVLFVGVLFVAVFPTRTYLDQRASAAEKESELEALRRSNDDLAAQVELLERDSEIERMAREHYGLVFPGEEAYAILPPPEAPLVIPDTWPFTRLAARLSR